MRTSKIPRKIQRWIDRHPHLIDDTPGESVWMEDERHPDDQHNPYSIWLIVRKGYCVGDPGLHTLHEWTTEGFMYRVGMIEPCECEICKTTTEGETS